MKIVIGGFAQGKLEYVKNTMIKQCTGIVDGTTCSDEDLLTARVINQFHEYIRKQVQNGEQYSHEEIEKQVYHMVDTIMIKNPEVIIIADEVGCGVVPMNHEERAFREITGRAMCRLVQEAKEVYRVYCGIGTKIKGNS